MGLSNSSVSDELGKLFKESVASLFTSFFIFEFYIQIVVSCGIVCPLFQISIVDLLFVGRFSEARFLSLLEFFDLVAEVRGTFKL